MVAKSRSILILLATWNSCKANRNEIIKSDGFEEDDMRAIFFSELGS